MKLVDETKGQTYRILYTGQHLNNNPITTSLFKQTREECYYGSGLANCFYQDYIYSQSKRRPRTINSQVTPQQKTKFWALFEQYTLFLLMSSLSKADDGRDETSLEETIPYRRHSVAEL